MTTTQIASPDIVDRIVLGFVASRTGSGPGESKHVGQQTVFDGLRAHLNSDVIRDSLNRLISAGKIEITGANTYGFVTEREPGSYDVANIVLGYAHGRGIGIRFDLTDLLALPMLAPVRVETLQATLAELVSSHALSLTAGAWSLPMPTGPDRELIERIAGYVGLFEPGETATAAEIGQRFSDAPTHLIRVALDFLLTAGRIARVGVGTYGNPR